MFITDETKLVRVAAAAAAGTTAVVSAGVDMTQDGGFEGVHFFAAFGVANANNTLKAQQSDDDGVADDYTDLAGSEVSTGASDEEVSIDVLKPGKRFVRVAAARGTSSALGDVFALLYQGRRRPTRQSIVGTRVSEQNATPAEGTA